jgi:hypothetical protein
MTPRQKDGVLWLWSTTDFSASEIGKRLGVTRSAVLSYVKRQRDKGDVRAANRVTSPKAEPTIPQLAQQIADLQRTVAAMRQERRMAA